MPEWLRAKEQKPTLEYYEEIKEMARFRAFDIETLPADEYEVWRGRWRDKCHIGQDYRIEADSETLAMLVRLRDKELVAWLLARLEQGQGTSGDAAEVIGDSGQEWLIPSLEKTLFLEPEDEPQAEPPPKDAECVVLFGTVSDASFNALRKIVQRSRIIAPRVKSWFSLAFHDSNREGEPSVRRELLKQWWALNKERMAAGDFRHLQIIPLWPGETTDEREMGVPYISKDYVEALYSDQVRIRIAAIETIISKKLASEVNLVDLKHVAGFVTGEDPALRYPSYWLLDAAGDHATTILKKLMDEDPSKVPGHVTVRALKTNPFRAGERARIIATIVAHDSTSYMANHMSMSLEAYPLLKRTVLDTSLPESDRTSAACYLGRFASRRDLPFLEQLMDPGYPTGVRGWTLHAICRLSPPGDPPQCVRKLENDPELGSLIKDYKYLEKPVEAKASDAGDSSYQRGFSDKEVAGKFASLITSDQFTGHGLAYDLVRSGDRGVALLKTALTMSNDTVKGNAALALLQYGIGSEEEREGWLPALVAGLGDDDNDISNYLHNREDLHAKVMPLFKQRVLDDKLQPPVRIFAALHAAVWATEADLPFFESLLSSDFPVLRSVALHAYHRILPPEKLPDFIRTLAADPDLGEVIKIYHYGEGVR